MRSGRNASAIPVSHILSLSKDVARVAGPALRQAQRGASCFRLAGDRWWLRAAPSTAAATAGLHVQRWMCGRSPQGAGPDGGRLRPAVPPGCCARANSLIAVEGLRAAEQAEG
jgi:hypothetical protein